MEGMYKILDHRTYLKKELQGNDAKDKLFPLGSSDRGLKNIRTIGDHFR